MQQTGPVMIEERHYSGSVWIAIRARGAEWSLFTPDEAARIGRELLDRYGAAQDWPVAQVAAE